MALEEADIDWFELAREVAERKFGLRKSESHRSSTDHATDHAASQKEKAKRMRFMQYRGFSYDQIKYALDSSVDDDSFDHSID